MTKKCYPQKMQTKIQCILQMTEHAKEKKERNEYKWGNHYLSRRNRP